jgi:hypothetical protein
MIALKSRVRLHKSSIKARKGRWADVIGGGVECQRVMVKVMLGNLHNDHRAAVARGMQIVGESNPAVS